jgi:thiamine-phosphate pyrophosphorylase
LFGQGLKIFHLRKPGYTIDEMQNFLKAVQPRYLRRIMIHSNYELIGKYNLGGIHLSGDYLKKVSESTLKGIYSIARKKNLKVSTSIHRLEELNNLSFNYDYVFLSPVFDSISKPGYLGTLSHQEISESLKHKKIKTEVIGLGGIDQTTLGKAMEMNFDGVALLGALWKEFSKSGTVFSTIEIFNLIKEKCQTAEQTH